MLLAFIVSPVSAKPDEPVEPFPDWATWPCIETIYRIVQHEAGNTKSDIIFSFITEQIIRDITSGRFECNSLTRWRWAIGNYPLSKVSYQVKVSVLTTIAHYPKFEYKECKLIGMKSDILVWNHYGYNTTIGFEKTANNMTVVGVNCKQS